MNYYYCAICELLWKCSEIAPQSGVGAAEAKSGQVRAGSGRFGQVPARANIFVCFLRWRDLTEKQLNHA